MSIYGERKHSFLKQLLWCGFSGNHKRHVANEPRAAATFHVLYSPRSSLACHFTLPNRRSAELYIDAGNIRSHL
jgi:hypothetical protein